MAPVTAASTNMTDGALSSLARAGTGLAALPPPRASTNPPEEAERTERKHLHRRLHASTLSHGSTYHRHRDRARDTVQSAIDLKPPISFDQLLRRGEKKTITAEEGRREQQQRDIAAWRAQQQIQADAELRKRVTPAEVEKVRKENEQREEELRRSLKEVEEAGMRATRDLDDTYYAILEKAAVLRATVNGMMALAQESKGMHETWQSNTGILVADTQKNIRMFKGFEQQERVIGELVAKLRHSRDETIALDERLEAARKRVEGYERRERAKRSMRRKQWHATWGTVAGVLVLLFALLLLKNRRRVARELDAVGWSLGAVSAVAEEAAANLGERLRPFAATSAREDPFLSRIFDEI